MATKTSVTSIVVDHFDTLRDARTHRMSFGDLATQFGLPVLLGAVLPIFGLRLVELGQVIAGLAVLAGLTFGLLVFVFQLRLQLSSDPRVQATTLRQLIDQLFVNVAYTVLIGLTSAAVCVAVVSVRWGEEASSGSQGVSAVASGVVVGLCVHFLLSLAMCTKRAYRAYQRIS